MTNPNINNNLPLDKAELIAFFLESLLYGVSLLLYGITVWVLIYQRKTERLNLRLAGTASIMMLLGTIHLSIDLARILEGFIVERDAPGGPIGYFSKLYLWTHVFKTAIFAAQTVIADSFATYRCWVVWGRSWAVILPAIMVLGTLSAGIGIVHGCAVLREGEDVFASSLTGWITSFFSLTLATNIICTSLIAFRIWFTTRKVSRFSGQQTLMPVIIIVVESGAIYSISCITLLTVYLIGSNAQYPALDGTFPIISIVFNLIIVRIALGIAHGGTGGTGMQSTQNPTTHLGERSFMSTSNAQYPMKPLAVTVTQLVHKESDADTDAHGKDQDSFTGKEPASWNAV